MDDTEGLRPAEGVEPDTAEALAEALAECSRGHRAVLLRGGGTKIDWGRPVERVDVLVSTRRLKGIVRHERGDLTLAVRAGATIAEVNRELAQHGQWLPLDAVSDASTIGGTIAANDSGPSRHRHGTPRDLLIGIGLATTDGRVVKAGGNVVKNVAGYDLGRLMCGSFGGLAAIVTASFKLAPLPPVSGTLCAAFSTPPAAARAAATLAGSQLEPLALDVHASEATELLVRFASTAAAVDAQVAEAERLVRTCAPDRIVRVSGAGEDARWRDQIEGIWRAPGAIVKTSWLPAALGDVMSLVANLRRIGAASTELAARAGVGTGLIRIEADAAGQAAAVRRLRERRDLLQHVVLLRADRGVKALVDVWGEPGDTAGLLRALKHALDPAGILNAGRGPF
ncbi:MAG: FAD-binding oxidoreductase [Acidobacteria bacterium]|nr:FAD-binding oxidoreductase [Acidobacteriota bacterium]